MNEIAPRPITWIVRSGDTLSQIAVSHRVSVATLLAANPACRADPNLVRVGQVIVLPPPPAPAAQPARPDSPPSIPRPGRCPSARCS